MSISNFLENRLLDLVLNKVAYTPPANLWLALWEGDPTDAGTGGSEAGGGSYARIPVTFGPPANRQVANPSQLTFPVATGNWQTTQLDHYAIFSDQVAGDFLGRSTLTTPLAVVAGNTPTVPANDVILSFLDLAGKTSAGNNISNYLAHSLLNHTFRNTPYTPPDIFNGYSQTIIADSDSGSSVTEPSGNGYARVRVYENGGGAPAFKLAVGDLVQNADQIIMPAPTGSWGTLVASFMADQLSTGSGNLLFYTNNISNQAIGLNDTVMIPVDGFNGRLS